MRGALVVVRTGFVNGGGSVIAPSEDDVASSLDDAVLLLDWLVSTLFLGSGNGLYSRCCRCGTSPTGTDGVVVVPLLLFGLGVALLLPRPVSTTSLLSERLRDREREPFLLVGVDFTFLLLVLLCERGRGPDDLLRLRLEPEDLLPDAFLVLVLLREREREPDD